MIAYAILHIYIYFFLLLLSLARTRQNECEQRQSYTNAYRSDNRQTKCIRISKALVHLPDRSPLSILINVCESASAAAATVDIFTYIFLSFWHFARLNSLIHSKKYVCVFFSPHPWCLVPVRSHSLPSSLTHSTHLINLLMFIGFHNVNVNCWRHIYLRILGKCSRIASLPIKINKNWIYTCRRLRCREQPHYYYISIVRMRCRNSAKMFC